MRESFSFWDCSISAKKLKQNNKWYSPRPRTCKKTTKTQFIQLLLESKLVIHNLYNCKCNFYAETTSLGWLSKSRIFQQLNESKDGHNVNNYSSQKEKSLIQDQVAEVTICVPFRHPSLHSLSHYISSSVHQQHLIHEINFDKNQSVFH